MEELQAKTEIAVSVVNGVIACPDVVTILKGNKKVKIVWILDEASLDAKWRFQDKGIQFYGDTQDQFADGGGEDLHKKFKWKDENSKTGLFSYGIYLENKRTGEQLVKDPAIQNEGDR